MCALHRGAEKSSSGVGIHVIKLRPWLQLSSSLTTRDKQQQQAKHEPVLQSHCGTLTAHLSNY